VVGFEYVKQNTVLQGARPYSAHVESLASPAGPVVDTGSLNSPGGFFVLPVPNVLDPTGVGTGWFTHIAGSTGRALNDYRPFDTSTDLYNYAPQAYLQTPTERGVLWVSGCGDLGSSVEWFGEGLFHRARTEQQYSPATYSSFNEGAAPSDPVSGQQYIPASNGYNPFGTDVLGVISTLSSGGPRTFDQHIATYRTVLGLRGRLAQWRWEGSVTWAQSDANQYSTDEVLRANVRNAVGPSGPDATGKIVCGMPDAATGLVPSANIIPGCVPLNLFAGPLAVTPDQLAYIERNLRDFGRNRHIVADLAITGAFGRLPAGELQWAFGGQYRRESGSYVLDPQIGEGITGFVTTGIPNPSIFTSREAFL
jgi:iron complex outermembrane recepter protein